MLNRGRSRPAQVPAPPSQHRNGAGDANSAYATLRERVQQRLLAEVNPAITGAGDAEVRRALERIFTETVAESGLPMSRSERSQFYDQVVADILGLGPLEALLQDDTITEVLVNGPHQVVVERNGVLEETTLQFRDHEDVMRIIERIVAPLGRRVDESSPMVDARLPDGSRVNVIIPPLSLTGPCLSIRKFAKSALSHEDMIRYNTFTPEMLVFLHTCVQAKLNFLISGGTSTGKKTVLNSLT